MSLPPTAKTRAAGLVNEGNETAEELRQRKFNEDQSFIARSMVWVFALSVGTTLIAIFFSPLVTRDWKDLILNLLEVLKVAVVPMFAMVAGYYLPKSGR